MAWGPVNFLLADGASLVIPGDDVRRVYDMLWELCSQPGALSTAALLIDTSRLAETPSAIELTTAQSNVLRQAVARLDAAA